MTFPIPKHFTEISDPKGKPTISSVRVSEPRDERSVNW